MKVILHNRKLIRLKGFDYSSSNAYFVTICCKDFTEYFGFIKNQEMILSNSGIVVYNCWTELETTFNNISLDEFIVMPNHFHGIICIIGDPLSQKQDFSIEKTKGWILMKNPDLTLGKIIRHFKAKSAKLIRESYNKKFKWQPRYFDRIVRNEREMNSIREYIASNPLKWNLEKNIYDETDSIIKLL